MDTRKLRATADGYLSTEHDGYLQLVTPFRENAFRNQHGMVDEEPRRNAKEFVRRWNLHLDLMHLCELVAAGNTDYDQLEEIASDILTKLNA